jgi:hypothetical protein
MCKDDSIRYSRDNRPRLRVKGLKWRHLDVGFFLQQRTTNSYAYTFYTPNYTIHPPSSGTIVTSSTYGAREFSPSGIEHISVKIVNSSAGSSNGKANKETRVSPVPVVMSVELSSAIILSGALVILTYVSNDVGMKIDYLFQV